MTRRPLAFLLPAAVLLAAGTLAAGGWAVTTVEDLPDRIEAGKPLTLTYTVRQHGHSLLPGLHGGLEATLGALNVRADARGASKTGQYTATLTLPQPGEWTITIHTGFMASTVELPMRVVPAGSAALAPLPEVDRGERLFVAKGCVTCHTTQIAPALVPNKYQSAFLRQILADPSTMPRSGRYNDIAMPNLGLKPSEIAALAAYINDASRAQKITQRKKP